MAVKEYLMSRGVPETWIKTGGIKGKKKPRATTMAGDVKGKKKPN